MKYDYPGGVEEWERPIVEKFEDEILPFTIKHGPRIGEAAMKGDQVAEEIIRRQQMFCEGLPEMRGMNFRMLVAALKTWSQNEKV